MKKRVLVLDGTYQAIQVIEWEDAFYLISLDKAEIICEYEDWTVRSANAQHKVPSVIKVKAKNIKRFLNLNSINIFRRDQFRCAYCGDFFSKEHLTIDHIVPKSQGGAKRSWENMITACSGCNHTKAAKTPSQADMPLLFQPVTPSWSPKLALVGKEYPPEWEDWLW